MHFRQSIVTFRTFDDASYILYIDLLFTTVTAVLPRSQTPSPPRCCYQCWPHPHDYRGIYFNSNPNAESTVVPLIRSPCRTLHRVAYELCLLMHAVHVDRCHGYIADLVTPTSSLPGRDRLRSAAENRYELSAIHDKFDERAFSHVGPATWNNSPPHITETIDTEAFKISLKTYLFKLAYSLWLL